jgi:hypothetical protein
MHTAAKRHETHGVRAKGVAVMFRCILCAFETELDDTVVTAANGRCICLGCYTRETGNHKMMTKGLRKELTAALAVSE